MACGLGPIEADRAAVLPFSQIIRSPDASAGPLHTTSGEA